jgi:uncharacterized protein YqhQ
MRQYRSYNPNTKYGRRKLREQAYERISNYTPQEKAEYDKTKFGCSLVILIIFIVACLLIYLILGPEALIEWLK